MQQKHNPIKKKLQNDKVDKKFSSKKVKIKILLLQNSKNLIEFGSLNLNLIYLKNYSWLKKNKPTSRCVKLSQIFEMSQMSQTSQTSQSKVVIDLTGPEPSPSQFIDLTAESDNQCCICLTGIELSEMSHSGCVHTFHWNCLSSWCGINSSCPLCRQPTERQYLRYPELSNGIIGISIPLTKPQLGNYIHNVV